MTTRPDGEKFEGSGSANVILYVGLGMVSITVIIRSLGIILLLQVCIGLVITFVGIGDKGFQTLELKLIGPSLVGCGVFFALLRILFCTVPACCAGCLGLNNTTYNSCYGRFGGSTAWCVILHLFRLLQ